jgi:chorismate mutase
VAERRVPAPDAELRRLRRRIDAVDRRIVALLDERTELVLEVGRAKRAAGRRAIRDGEREREVLLRVAVAKRSALPTEELLAIYRRLIAAMRRLEWADRRRATRGTTAAADGGDGTRPGR